MELRAGTGGTRPHQYHVSLELLEEKLAQKTNGQITVQIFREFQLGGERDMLEAATLGTLDIVASSTGPVGGFVRESLALDFPYLFRDRDHAYKVLDGPIGTSIRDKFIPKGMVCVAWLENGWRHITNNIRVIKTPEDLKGLKIRTMENEIHAAYFRALGANAVPIPGPEIYNALQQKVVDGQENPYINIWNFKWYEVQKYCSETGHLYSPAVIVFSKQTWDKLPADIQQFIADLRPEMSKVSRDFSKKADDELVAKLRATGLEILQNIDKAPFVKAADPVYQQFGDRVGKELLDQIRSA
jgi:tripartite ATP-independent transporter DctP family solute receptor